MDQTEQRKKRRLDVTPQQYEQLELESIRLSESSEQAANDALFAAQRATLASENTRRATQEIEQLEQQTEQSAEQALHAYEWVQQPLEPLEPVGIGRGRKINPQISSLARNIANFGEQISEYNLAQANTQAQLAADSAADANRAAERAHANFTASQNIQQISPTIRNASQSIQASAQRAAAASASAVEQAELAREELGVAKIIKQTITQHKTQIDSQTITIEFDVSRIPFTIPKINDIQPGQPNYFNANMNVANLQKLFLLSDIHGDMYSFIINLRDNAKVIRKKMPLIFNQDVLDSDLERQMNVNLNHLRDYTTNAQLTNLLPEVHQYSYQDNIGTMQDYNDDMNYEWCGGNAHIVIVGDIIDNYRVTQLNNKTFGEHIHEEIKLVRFINAIDDLARAHGGRVIKLFGNHDLIGVYDYTLRHGYDRYISPYALDISNNIHGINRQHYFNSNTGKKLLRYNGMGIILKINNYLCVHGAFTGFKDLLYNGQLGNLQIINDIILNLLYTDNINTLPPELTKYNEFIFGNEGLLFNRDYGKPEIISTKYYQNEMDNYCNNTIIPGITTACDPQDALCQANIKLVIGHCIQGSDIGFHKHTDPNDPYLDRRFKNQGYQAYSFDAVSQTQTLVPNLAQINDINVYHYGMSISCISGNPANIVPRLLRVDVGVSRAFDSMTIYRYRDITYNTRPQQFKTEYIKRLYDYLKSKLPQILEVNTTVNPNTMQLRRTTIKNMLIHQPRDEIFDPTRATIKADLITYSNTNNAMAGGYINYKFINSFINKLNIN